MANKRSIGKIAFLCGIAIFLFIPIQYWFFSNGGEIIGTFKQPGNITYDYTYEMRIKEGSRVQRIWSNLRRLEISVYRIGNKNGYGHRTEIFVPGTDVSKTAVSWNFDGITVAFDTGHSLFIPKSAFVGGR